MPPPRARLSFARWRPLSGTVRRLLFGVAITVAATALRLAVDPLIHEQIPYFIYVASAVVATWFGGVLAGACSTLLAAFAGNYFFVNPRLEFVPSTVDLIAMGLFSIVALGLVGVVSQWRAAEEAARLRAKELQTLLDTVPAAVFVARDAEASILEANRAGAEFLRVPLRPDGTLAQEQARYRVVRHGGEVPPDELPMRQAARGRHIRDCELDIIHADGTRRTLFGNAAPLRTEDDEAAGSVGAFVDVTARKQAEEALRQADRVKDEFLATLSHELRTPLNAIVGWTSMLLQGRLDENTVGRAYQAIARNAAAQRDLIEDVLDVSRIVSGKLRLEPTYTDLGHPLGAAVDAIRPAAAEKGVTLSIEPSAEPGVVWGDPARLEQVFSNLLSNAVKFSAEGGSVEVAVTSRPEHLEVAVIDHGAGIDPDFLPFVFDRFRQGDSSSTRTHGGLGLGLSIVRRLVELHAGTVTAESQGEGTGTTMTVRLPRPPADRRRHTRKAYEVAAESTEGEPPSLAGLRVVVVDDQADARDMAALALANHGAVVVTAGSAHEALRALREAPPDLLVIDLAMPEVDGYTLIGQVRGLNGPAARTPAIALTAYAREEDRSRVLASGFQLHLSKPVEPVVLVRAVYEVCRQQPQ